ncbi:Uncharacterised protein [Chlamydia abortus]|nr:Uncharacterised protein [Chlamydia abortus]
MLGQQRHALPDAMASQPSPHHQKTLQLPPHLPPRQRLQRLRLGTRPPASSCLVPAHPQPHRQHAHLAPNAPPTLVLFIYLFNYLYKRLFILLFILLFIQTK